VSQLKRPMDIFKLLDKSNCRKCNKPSCLAFAAAVFKGEKELEECPSLKKETLDRYGGKVVHQRVSLEKEEEKAVARLKQEVAAMDLSSAADRLGSEFSDGKLTVRCLGKEFSIDGRGNLITDIHVHAWIAVPVLNYILYGTGVPVSGDWVPFRELAGGQTWHQLFEQRCEKPLKEVADNYTDLFRDMMRLFEGRQVENHYAADVSLVLYPLPKVPVLICYWKPDEAFESDLNIFFDATADQHLNIESIFTLSTGLAIMFKKVSLRHGEV
jgi:hypothetical protein